MVLNVYRNHKAYWGRGIGGGGEEGDDIPIATLSPQNDSCIKMDIDESHLNVSLIVRDKITRRCPQTTTFES